MQENKNQTISYLKNNRWLATSKKKKKLKNMLNN